MRELAAFYAEAAELVDRLDAAKAARAEGGDSYDKAELASAMEEINAFRSYWRKVGAAVNPKDDDGDVTIRPEAVSGAATVGTIGGDSQ